MEMKRFTMAMMLALALAGCAADDDAGQEGPGFIGNDPDAGPAKCDGVGSSCNDSDPCTVNDKCQANGTCQGTPFICDDGAPCTLDICDSGVCVHTVEPAFCFINANCMADQQPHPTSDCLFCDALSQQETWSGGLGESCNDGDLCTINDECSEAGCYGEPLECEDDDPCTSNACLEGQCVFDPDPVACGACNFDAECEDNNVCTSDACVAGQCQFGVVGGGCSDGDLCTSGDACSNGECVGTLLTCNDLNPCTADACVGGACQYTPIDECSSTSCTSAGQCADSDPCTSDACVAGFCQNTAIPGCGENACTSDAQCDDGNVCTVGDACVNGSCVPGGAKDSDVDGYVDEDCGGDDCEDGQYGINPGLPEVCGDGVDNDCNDFTDADDAACAPAQEPCDNHQECAPEGQICGFWPTFGDDRCSDHCATHLECGADEICVHVSGTANLGYCRPPLNANATALGGQCTVGADCLDESCLGGGCAKTCGGEVECEPSDFSCTPAGSLSLGFHAVCAEDVAGFSKQGANCTAGASCSTGHCDQMAAASKCAPLCTTDDDCQWTQECNVVLVSDNPIPDAIPAAQSGVPGTYDAVLGCYTRVFQSASVLVGQPCSGPETCRSNKCMAVKKGSAEQFCTTYCTSESDCAPGMLCGLALVTADSYFLAGIGDQPPAGAATVARICQWP